MRMDRVGLQRQTVLLLVPCSRSLLEGGGDPWPALCRAHFAASPRATCRDAFQIKRG